MRVDGMVDRRFEPVREAFAETVSGGAVAVWLDGHWVVDLWDWSRDSIAMPYSVSKPFAAMTALTLVDRGLLELEAPMRRYWPEFRAPATVRQVLSHQAGVVALDEPAGTELFYDWDRLCGLLANQEPAWEPGTAHGESALFYGHLVGELVRRIDGRSVGRFLREEVTGPLELDFAFGLPLAEQARVVNLTGFEAVRSTEGRPELYARAIANPPGAREPRVANSALWRAAEIPAINGHGTARGVAGLYAALLQGKALSPGLLAEATTAQCRGIDRVFGQETAWGLGFAVYPGGFGMGGLGGSFGGTSDGYAIGFVTATLGDHTRLDRIENVFRSCLGLAPL